jgi:hypothetical protein
VKICTYFDVGYESRARALLASASLGKQVGVTVLLLDEESKLDPPEQGTSKTLAVFLRENPSLAKRVSQRSRVEQIFSIGPSFLLGAVGSLAPDEWLVYLDADLFFFRPLESYLDDFEHANVIVSPHRHFAWNRKRLSKYGEFNVGLVAFRNNKDGLAALNYWADSCLDWCSDIPEDGKYADQKYLENFNKVASGVVVDDRKGVNMAPWNLGFSKLSLAENGGLAVDGEPVYYFHAQGIMRTKNAWVLGHLPYFSIATRSAKKLVYKPYLASLLKWEKDNPATQSSSSRSSRGLASLVLLYLGKTMHVLLGQIIFDSQLRDLSSDTSQ